MKILSIDIGMKNLAFCLFEKPEDSEYFYIKKWDVVNICEKQSFHCTFLEKNVVCNKPAKFQKENQCFCLKHSKKQSLLLIPKAELKSSFLNKQKLGKLIEIADHYKISHEKGTKKADLLSAIHHYIHTTCLEEIVHPKASQMDLITMGINIMCRFNMCFNEEEHIEYVIIENQISPIANRMKTIQGMIAQYFIMSDVSVDHIEFISAINKLKEFSTTKNQDKGKMTYGDRKKLGIQKCWELISQDHRFQEKTTFFTSHQKKDDLADSFLQGWWFIQHSLNK
jgi:hypothetical protein